MRTILTRFRGLLLVLALIVAFAPLGASLLGQGYSNTNAYAYWVPPGACNTAVSGTAAGTQGLTVAGASNTPVVQARASALTTHSLTFICNITPPNTIITSGNGILIEDAVFAYSAVNILNATQAAVLASGTMNGSTVFSYIAYPTPAAGETGSTVTPVRADSGSLTITPAVASFNVTTNTAGSFYTARFTPAAGTLAFKTDLRQLLLTVKLEAALGLDTTVNSSGVLVHFRGQ